MSQDDHSHRSSGLRADVRKTLEGLDDAEADELARTWQLAALAADREPDEEAVASALDRFLSMIGIEQGRELLPKNGRPANGRHRRGHSLPPQGGNAARGDAVRGAARRRLPPAAVAAAAAAILVTIALALLWPRTTTVIVPPGEIADETLPDGSHVVLSSSSELAYRTGLFADSRRVYLDGEAFFTVTEHDRTFRVETFNATVTALGTSFNVRAPRESRHPSTRVALATGSVKLIPHGSDERTVWLRPGEMSEVDRSGLPSAPSKVSVEAEAAWRTGGFVMLSQPLGSVAEQLQRRFGVAIVFRSEELAANTLSVNLPAAESAEVVLADICSVVGCSFRTEDGVIVVETGS